MLSRVAGSLYRLGTMAERADHIARVVDIHLAIALDLGGSPGPYFWPHALVLAGLPESGAVDQEAAIAATLSGEGPSLRHAIQTARREAMSVRPVLSSEVYESLNELHWAVAESDPGSNFHEMSVRIQRGIAMLYGLINETMDHDEPWEFLRLGRELERATCGVRLVTRELISPPDRDDGVDWAAVLRCCRALEAYRWRFSTDIDAFRVVRFLLLDRTLPHSARNAISEALTGIRRIENDGEPSEPRRLLGQLSSLFELTLAREIVADPDGFETAYTIRSRHLQDSLVSTYFRPTRPALGATVGAPPIWSYMSGEQQQ